MKKEVAKDREEEVTNCTEQENDKGQGGGGYKLHRAGE